MTVAQEQDATAIVFDQARKGTVDAVQALLPNMPLLRSRRETLEEPTTLGRNELGQPVKGTRKVERFNSYELRNADGSASPVEDKTFAD